jgi:hypothetical protein
MATSVAEQPPEGPDDWTEEQWLEFLEQVPQDPESGHAHPLTRATSSPSGVVLGAAMLGLDQAIYGERPKVEIVAEADANGADEGDLELDLDNPSSSHIRVTGDG